MVDDGLPDQGTNPARAEKHPALEISNWSFPSPVSLKTASTSPHPRVPFYLGSRTSCKCPSNHCHSGSNMGKLENKSYARQHQSMMFPCMTKVSKAVRQQPVPTSLTMPEACGCCFACSQNCHNSSSQKVGLQLECLLGLVEPLKFLRAYLYWSLGYM